MKLYCCACLEDVNTQRVRGSVIYPHRPDLASKVFYKCGNNCGNYVGCHPNSDMPLGNIPTPELRNARQHIHKLIDPVWKSKQMTRSQLYTKLSKALGYQYHTAEIKTIEEARRIYRTAKTIIATQ